MANLSHLLKVRRRRALEHELFPSQYPYHALTDVQWAFVYQLLHIVALTVAKLSILLLYLRIFKSSRYHVVFYLVGAYAVMWCIGSLAVSIFLSRPMCYRRYPFEPATCINRRAFIIGYAITNIIGDVLVLISPIPIVWKLHTSTGKKVMISGIFLLGTLYVPGLSIRRLLCADRREGHALLASSVPLGSPISSHLILRVSTYQSCSVNDSNLWILC